MSYLTHRAVFPGYDENGNLVYTCTLSASGVFSLYETARRDIPAGLPFNLVPTSEIPTGEARDTWVFDFSNPDGYAIGREAWEAEQNGG